MSWHLVRYQDYEQVVNEFETRTSRTPSAVEEPDQDGMTSVQYTPDLTANEAELFRALKKWATTILSPEDFLAVKDDLASLKTWMGLTQNQKLNNIVPFGEAVAKVINIIVKE